ncbi:hypothetical protein A2U01_0009986, partial [Trifolium medium]|nr:hypothetical protein [Trifolium medium]
MIERVSRFGHHCLKRKGKQIRASLLRLKRDVRGQHSPMSWCEPYKTSSIKGLLGNTLAREQSLTE